MERLGKYKILELVGRGATAEVYRACEVALDREVALKVLRPALVPDVTIFERFLLEARVAARLLHPYIATVFDTGEADGRFYIAMRYVDGRSLDRIIREDGPLPPAEVLKLARQMGSALYFAHDRGFLHRDVKPANIIRSTQGDYILTDFGLARAMMSTGLTSHTGAILGTPAYVAPEVWLNEPVGPAVDQYSLACVLYEALMGRVLFEGPTPPAVMTAHILKGPGSLEGLPPAMVDPIRHALHQKPAERFPDLRAFVLALEGGSIPIPSIDPAPAPSPSPAPAAKPSPVLSVAPSVSPTQPILPPPTDQLGTAPKQKSASFHWPVWATILLALGGLVALLGCGLAFVFWDDIFYHPPTQQALMTPVIITPPDLDPTRTPRSPVVITPETNIIVLPTVASNGSSPPTKPPAAPTDSPIASPEPPALQSCTDVGQTTIAATDGATMLCVPAGDFLMGSDSSEAWENESPVHNVYLDAFWIDKTEVTNAMYARCVAAGVCREPYQFSSKTRDSYFNHSDYANYPVIFIDMNDAQDYCNWVGGRLPTEAEWEKAARGTDGRTYPWGNSNLDRNHTNYNENEGDTTAVGSYPSGASPYGALDMLGNVWEWTSDWLSDDYYSLSPRSNPAGPASGEYIVWRGGSFGSVARVVRVSNRYGGSINYRKDSLGFRCVR